MARLWLSPSYWGWPHLSDGCQWALIWRLVCHQLISRLHVGLQYRVVLAFWKQSALLKRFSPASHLPSNIHIPTITVAAAIRDGVSSQWEQLRFTVQGHSSMWTAGAGIWTIWSLTIWLSVCSAQMSKLASWILDMKTNPDSLRSKA